MALLAGSPGPLYRENTHSTVDAAAGPAGSAVAVAGREPCVSNSVLLAAAGRRQRDAGSAAAGRRGTRTSCHAVPAPPPGPQQIGACVNIDVRWPPKLEVKWGRCICFAFDKELEAAHIKPTVDWPHVTVFHWDWVNDDLRISLSGDGGNVKRFRSEYAPPLRDEGIGNTADLKTVMQSQLGLINAGGVRCNLELYGNGLRSLRITGQLEHLIESVRAQLQIEPGRPLHVAVADSLARYTPGHKTTARIMYARAAEILQRLRGAKQGYINKQKYMTCTRARACDPSPVEDWFPKEAEDGFMQ